MNKLIVLLIFISLNSTYCQIDFTTIGDSNEGEENCFVITPDLNGQKGGVWFNNPIDFGNDFKINYQNNFGYKNNNGADGMALVFKKTNTPEIGNSGAGIGYAGIDESLTIEFDTYRNTRYNDPSQDHISIMLNGEANHSSANNLAGPVSASRLSNNIEDGKNHNIIIEWNSNTQLLQVYFDCSLRLSLNRDIKNDIFNGDNSIYFGFVGSTGGSSNLHQICFNYISFIDGLNLEDKNICKGETLSINVTKPNSISYLWSPSNGISNVNIPNPTFSPTETTTYNLRTEDECGNTYNEEFTINVSQPTTPTFNEISTACGIDFELPNSSTNGISGTWAPDFDPYNTTTYTFTPSLNQCASKTTIKVEINSNEEPIFETIAPICKGTIIELPKLSLNGIAGTWSPIFDPYNTTTYTFTPNNTKCSEIIDKKIFIKPDINLSIKIDEEVKFNDKKTIINVAGGSGNYSYKLNNESWQENSTFKNIEICEPQTITVRDNENCEIEKSLIFSLFDYPKFFSPNSDGINDYWNINCFNRQDATIHIFDRYGKILKKLSTLDKGWDGTYNGTPLPVTDYWFKINYKNENDELIEFKGHFSLTK